MKKWLPHLFLALSFVLNSVSHAAVPHCHGTSCDSSMSEYGAIASDHDHADHAMEAQDQDADHEKDDSKLAKADSHGWHSHAYGSVDATSYLHIPTQVPVAAIAWFNASHTSTGHEPPIDPPSLA